MSREKRTEKHTHVNVVAGDTHVEIRGRVDDGDTVVNVVRGDRHGVVQCGTIHGSIVIGQR